MIALFHRQPPSFFFFPDHLLYKMGAFGCHAANLEGCRWDSCPE